MGTRAEHADPPDLMALLGEIVNQSERLIRQQYELFKGELGQAARDAGGAALAAGAGAGLLAVSGVLTTAAAVHLLHRLTRLPLWACYGLLAAAAAGSGAGLLASARSKAAGLERPVLPQSAAALRDNVTWLRNQLTTTPA